MDKDPKIIDINQHRGKVEKRRTQQQAYKSKKPHGTARQGSDLRWFHYVQFFFMLAIIAYGMTICQRPS